MGKIHTVTLECQKSETLFQLLDVALKHFPLNIGNGASLMTTNFDEFGIADWQFVDLRSRDEGENTLRRALRQSGCAGYNFETHEYIASFMLIDVDKGNPLFREPHPQFSCTLDHKILDPVIPWLPSPSADLHILAPLIEFSRHTLENLSWKFH